MQNQEAIKRETELNRRIEELENQESASAKYASSSLSDEKSLELFRQLEKAMREDKIYQDKTLNKDKMAELLGTNRTYLSRIINEHAQTSFTHYVNRFRIDEAIRTLSDPANDIPLKALASELGFNSISTFYNLFQSTVGMTPAQYRSKVHELEKRRWNGAFLLFSLPFHYTLRVNFLFPKRKLPIFINKRMLVIKKISVSLQ